MTSESPDGVRTEFQTWLRATWDPDLSLVAWRQQLVAARWATPSWPAQWNGRDLPAWADEIVATELNAHGAAGTPTGVGMGLAAPTILTHGPDALRERFLPPIVTGEETWCQLFSEPGAGSDLAGLTTRAERDGDEWTVNGQKVWNTSAHHAQFGLLVARTDWDAPKHRGITYFAIPMEQPGVLVGPLRQMNGHASFNEVFFTDARIPNDFVIGTVNDGWSVARTTLAHERRFGAMRADSFGNAKSGRAVDEARQETALHFAPYVWYPQRAGRVDLLVDRARATARNTDAIVRQEIARVLSLQRVSAWTADRARANRAAGRPPGPEGSIGKLALSAVARASARTHSLIAGASALLTGDAAPIGGVVTEVLLSVPAQSIAGGTDEIQRNILAENILGLPREPNNDRDQPFRALPRNG
jgi:alkylation response protein AidB-like acyl-CoA dehydrogenase